MFLYRIAGVAVDQERVLLRRSEHDAFSALPGGRVEVGETSAQTRQREMLEEIGVEIEL